jgi:hypothetical protein
MPIYETKPAVPWIGPNISTQSGAGADPAERPQDRRDFDSWNQPDCHLDLAVRRSSAPSRWAGGHHALCHSKTLAVVH